MVQLLCPEELSNVLKFLKGDEVLAVDTLSKDFRVCDEDFCAVLSNYNYSPPFGGSSAKEDLIELLHSFGVRGAEIARHVPKCPQNKGFVPCIFPGKFEWQAFTDSGWKSYDTTAQIQIERAYRCHSLAWTVHREFEAFRFLSIPIPSSSQLFCTPAMAHKHHGDVFAPQSHLLPSQVEQMYVVLRTIGAREQPSINAKKTGNLLWEKQEFVPTAVHSCTDDDGVKRTYMQLPNELGAGWVFDISHRDGATLLIRASDSLAGAILCKHCHRSRDSHHVPQQTATTGGRAPGRATLGGTDHWILDLSHMQQINPVSGFSRPLRRLNPSTLPPAQGAKSIDPPPDVLPHDSPTTPSTMPSTAPSDAAPKGRSSACAGAGAGATGTTSHTTSHMAHTDQSTSTHPYQLHQLHQLHHHEIALTVTTKIRQLVESQQLKAKCRSACRAIREGKLGSMAVPPELPKLGGMAVPPELPAAPTASVAPIAHATHLATHSSSTVSTATSGRGTQTACVHARANGASSPEPAPQPAPEAPTIKVIVRGEAGVGVTSLVDMFTSARFPEVPSKQALRLRSVLVDLLPSHYAAQTNTATTNNTDNTDNTNNTAGPAGPAAPPATHTFRVRLEVRDVRSTSRATPLAGKMYREPTTAVLLAFDVTRKATLLALEGHFNSVLRYTRANGVRQTPTPIVLVGMKGDVPESGRQVSFEQAKSFAQERGLPYCETSARDGQHCVQLPFFIVAAVVAQQQGWLQSLGEKEAKKLHTFRLLQSIAQSQRVNDV